MNHGRADSGVFTVPRQPKAKAEPPAAEGCSAARDPARKGLFARLLLKRRGD
ncbi:hypothetical protein J2TS6_30360 [Paenibacillus albilobatus]|uniref:Uncharacterized protein n=1 Tax=Paenibacillus albilobatus TaxID=2716884 RepID=A0A919XK09_9BACL|nr:hypothetical protein J2TS6_30360 [Paenibacillus albilobatus]